MKQRIGTNAGVIWSCLDEQGKQTLKDLKKTSKLNEKDMHAALGWLAREGKVAFNQLKDDVEVALI